MECWFTCPGVQFTQGDSGVGERMQREGLLHQGVEMRFGGEGHRIDFQDLVGKSIMVYAQQEVVKDLIAARIARITRSGRVISCKQSKVVMKS